MEIHGSIHSSAALRAAARFFMELAAIQDDASEAPAASISIQATVAPVEIAVNDTKDKKPRSRAAKTEPAEPIPTPVADLVAPIESPPVETTAAVGATHDDIRILVGKLSQAGRRDEAVAIVRGFKGASSAACNGVKDILDKDLDAVLAALSALQVQA